MTVEGKSILNTFVSSVRGAVMQLGRAGLHVLGPDNFEYYMCAFKLLDSKGNMVAYMQFPVMPNNITESRSSIVSITKTAQGVVTQFNPTFAPIDISIQGTFGRKFRLLLGQKEFLGVAEGAWGKAQKFFNGNIVSVGNSDILIKTGYGLVKMLKNILDGAYALDADSSSPHLLIFENYSLNTHYVVEPIQRSFTQSTENNMVWYYNVDMRAVADSDDVSGTTSAAKFLGKVALNQLTSTIGNIINDCVQMIPL